MSKIRTRERQQLAKFEPILTHHAIQRLSERLEKESSKKEYIQLGNDLVWYDKMAHWIKPETLKKVIADIKSSLFEMTYFHPEKGLITEWKLGWYVLSPEWDVITIYTEFKKEHKANSKNVDFKFRTMYLNLHEKRYNSKDFKGFRDKQDRFWHLLK